MVDINFEGSRCPDRRSSDSARSVAPEQPATAKLFMHGRSQAVRLPKAFRFDGTEVRVTKVGDKIILEPLEPKPFDADAFWAKLDALGARDFLVDGLPEDRPSTPDPRKFV